METQWLRLPKSIPDALGFTPLN